MCVCVCVATNPHPFPSSQVERVIGMREGVQGSEFLVRWQGRGPTADTWELECDLVNCEELVEEYLKVCVPPLPSPLLLWVGLGTTD